MTHPHFLAHLFVRWVEFVSLVSLVGGIVYWNFVVLTIKRVVPEFKQQLLRRKLLITLLVLGVTLITDMIFRSLMMSGKPIGDLWPLLSIILLKTHSGKVFIGQGVLILLLTGFLLANHKNNMERLIDRLILTGLSIGLCLTVSLSGHAANRGSLQPTVLADVIHLLAVSAWVGGLFAVRLNLSSGLSGLKEPAFSSSLRIGIQRFSMVAILSVGALMVGGLYNTTAHVASPELLVGTPYGRILIVKWTLILPMLILGGLIRYGIFPLLLDLSRKTRMGFLACVSTRFIKLFLKNPAPIDLSKWFFRMVTIEAVLGLMVLFCSAWMTQLAPPHQRSIVPVHTGHTGKYSGPHISDSSLSYNY